MVLGDLNAKIGKDKAYENVTGKHTLHEVSNQNGELICNFAMENNMTVMSTQFQRKTIHKGTCTSPQLTLKLLTTTIVELPSNASKWQMVFNSGFKGLTTVNQIDHTHVRKR